MHGVGDIVGQRFLLEAEIGRGAAGTVFRARGPDGALAAVKVLSTRGRLVEVSPERIEQSPELVSASRALDTVREERRRLADEAALLARADHDAIVRYVAHGDRDDEPPWLAMEWVAGPTLAARLAAGPPLGRAEILAMTRRLAHGLASLHALGVVHRDVKPANVLLPGGEAARAKLGDFGIARSASDARSRDFVGSLAFMAPEQLGAGGDQGPPVDVFALGRLLYECAVGGPAFAGATALAVVLRIVGDAPEQMSAATRCLGPDVSALLTAMLEKDPLARPSASEVAARLGDALVRTELPEEAADTVPGARALLRREQRLDCVLVASLGHHHARLDDPGPITRARALVQAHGGRAALLAGRWLWVAFDEDEALTARAIRAGVTALALADALPDTPIALSLAPISHGPSTTVIDRVAALLEPGAPTRTTHATHGRVLVDEGARGLLEGRFELEPTEHGVRLVRAVSTEHSVTRARHRVRGRVLPCVGRDKELRQLEATLAGLEDEDPSPSAVVLVAAPGIGKTRLVDEALSRAPVRTRVIVARGDATAPGSALSLLSQWAQTLGGVSPHASAASRRAALQSALARVCSPEDAERISAFLSEASAAPDDRDDDASWAVRAARRDPALFRDQLRRAFTDALLALLAREPVILVVDDLQWADLPSMRLLEHLLARATDRPLAVLGTARLETPAELLGCLGPERVEIRLAPLAPRASARLVDLALDAPAPALREQLVDLGGGNPFYLEELVRAVTDEGVTALPSSVLAAAQGRLTDLGPELRRALRAASVFGLVFEPSAVGALTGEGDPGGALAALEREEIVVRRGDGAFAFRHAITREAAYAMLPDEDRAAAHRAAATWLLERGGADPIALAGHLEHAGEPQRAVEPWLRAARAAVAAYDHQAALSLVARALAHARASEAGELELVAAQATLLRGDHAASVGHAERALDTLPAGSASWFLAAETLVGGAIRAGLHEARQRGLDALEIAPLEAAREAFVHACAQVSADHFNTIGDAAVGRSTLERAEACAALVSDPLVLSRLAGARAAAASRAGEHERAIDAWEEALRYNERVGDAYRSLNVRNSVGHGLNELGRFERAVPHLERALADATALGEPLRVWHARTNLGRALGLRGEEARAHELLGRPLELARDNKLHAYFASLYLVELLLAMDRLEEARLAMEEAPRFAGLEGTPLRGFGRALEAELLRRAGSIDEALEQSRLALHEVGDLGSTASGARRAALERVRCLDAAGHVNDATLLARQARDHLRARADRLRDPISRRSFLEAIPEHRALLARAAVDGPDARVLDAAPHGAAQSGVQTEGEPAHAKPGSTRQ